MIEHGLLEIENFCCIQKAKINLAKAGLTLIVGDNQDTNAAINNGAGKTTIPKALTWCLYEDTLDGDRYDEVIRWGEDKTVVRHLVRVDKDVWRIVRSRTKGKPRLELSVARNFKKGVGFTPIEGERKELQHRIDKLLGKDFRSFCNTTLYGEGDISRFYSATDSSKKDSVHRLLKSDIFKKAMKHIKQNHYDGLKKKLEALEHELDVLNGKLEGYDIKQIKTSHKDWEEEREDRVVQCSEECRNYLSDIERAKKQESASRKEYEKELKEIKKSMRTLSVQKKRCSKSTEELQTLERDIGEVVERRIKVGENIKSKEDSWFLLQGDECPTCTSDLSEGKANEYKEEITKSLAKLKGELADLTNKDAELRIAISKKYEEVEIFRNANDEIKGLNTRKDVLHTLLESSDDKIAVYTKERKVLAEQALKKAKKIEQEKNPHGDLLQKTEENIEKINKKISEKRSELKAVRDDFAHYGFWVKGFGPGGLPSLLLDSKMDFLSERANDYLLTLADGDISISYKTQRELKQKGQIRDEIDAQVIIEGIPNVKPSKAQKRKLDIASDLGLMDMAVSRNGHSNLLMMDEVLDGMDSEGVRRVLDLIHRLRSIYPSIFVTTHEAGLLEIFERAICARKKNGATNVFTMKG